MSIQQDKEHAHRNFTKESFGSSPECFSSFDEQPFVFVPHIAERSLSLSIVIPASEPESMTAVPEFRIPDHPGLDPGPG